MVTVTMTSKGFSEGVNYNHFDKLVVGSEKRVTFLAEKLYKEVMEKTNIKKEVKKLKKLQKGFVSILGATVMMNPLRAFAESPMKSPFTVQGTGAITPPVVMEWGLTLALITVAAGVAISMITLAAAGIYRMFRKRDKSIEWTEDIVKGLIQVLIAIPTVVALFYLAQLIFKNLPALGGLF